MYLYVFVRFIKCILLTLFLGTVHGPRGQASLARIFARGGQLPISVEFPQRFIRCLDYIQQVN